ncbi:MAG: hypothetical protein ABIQ32_09070 [Sphingomicrobium sp.]
MDRFKEAARELQADQDEGRWEKRLRKVAKQRALPVKAIKLGLIIVVALAAIALTAFVAAIIYLSRDLSV